MSEHKNHGGNSGSGSKHEKHDSQHNDGSDHLTKRKKIATALKYRDHMKAPQVVANGKGAVADLIIELAKANGIPVEVDPDLAEVLSTLDYYEYIPPELYYAVAQILNKLYDVNQLIGEESKEGRRYAKKGQAEEAMQSVGGINVGADTVELPSGATGNLGGVQTTGDLVQDSNNAYHSGAVKFGRRMPPNANATKSNAQNASNSSTSKPPEQTPQAPKQAQPQPPQQKRQIPNSNIQTANNINSGDLPVDLNAITTKGVNKRPNQNNGQPEQPQMPPQVFHVTQTVNSPLGANNQQGQGGQDIQIENNENNPNIIRSAGSGTKKRAHQAQARPKNIKFDTDQILEQFNKRKR